MSFAGAVARQQIAVFRALGEDGQWAGVAGTVRIRCTERDDFEPFGASRDIVRVRFVRVRKAEVDAPAEGHVVIRESGDLLKVIAEPTLDRKGVWTCQVTAVAP